MFIERTPTEVGRGLLTTSLNLPVKMMKIGRIQMRRKNKLITFNLTGNLLNNRLKMELTTPRNKQKKNTPNLSDQSSGHFITSINP